MGSKEMRPTIADRTVRQLPSDQRRQLIDDHLRRIQEIATTISKQWTPSDMTAAEAIAQQRR